MIEKSDDVITIDGISYDPKDFNDEQLNYYSDIKLTDIEIQRLKFTLHIMEDYQQRCTNELGSSLANNETAT